MPAFEIHNLMKPKVHVFRFLIHLYSFDTTAQCPCVCGVLYLCGLRIYWKLELSVGSRHNFPLILCVARLLNNNVYIRISL